MIESGDSERWSLRAKRSNLAQIARASIEIASSRGPLLAMTISRGEFRSEN